MSAWTWALWAAAAAAALYLAVLAMLFVLGRRRDVRAVAGFIPDCVVLVRRLAADPRVPRSRKLMLAGLALYLALPFDLVPDFLPVVGQLDDAIHVALVLRSVVRSAGPGIVDEHWPGPPSSRALVLRLAGTAEAR